MLGALQRAHHYHRGGGATTRAQATVEQGEGVAELVERLRIAVQANEDQQAQLVQAVQANEDQQEQLVQERQRVVELQVRIEAANERIEELDDALEERAEKVGSAKADALAQQARADEAVGQVQMLTVQLLRQRGCSFCIGPRPPPHPPTAAAVAPAPQGAQGPPFAPKTPTG